MKNRPLVSIIIPVRDTREEYLQVCFESIKSQIYQNIEVIIIDDGSESDTATFLDEYTNSLKHWRVFHVENGGVSQARNKGIDVAGGMYIQFVDSDDALDAEAVSILVASAEKTQADAVVYDLSYYDESLTVLDYDQNYSHLTTEKSPFTSDDLDASGKFILEQLHPQPYTKLLSRAFLVEKKITFPQDIHIAEDHVFSLKVYMEARHIVVVDKPLYKYRASSTGAMSGAHKYPTDLIRAAGYVKDLLEDAGILNRWSIGLVDFIISNITYNQKCFGSHAEATRELYVAGAKLVNAIDKATLRARAAAGNGTAIGLLIADENSGLLDEYIEVMSQKSREIDLLEQKTAAAAEEIEARRKDKGLKESSRNLVNAVGRRVKRGKL